MTVKIQTKKRRKPTTGPEWFEHYRRQGFVDARNGVNNADEYANGMARRAYNLGQEQWVTRKREEG